MLARNWKHQWLLQCPAKLLRVRRIVGVVHPLKSKQNLRVFWKLVNLQDCVWENHCRIIMKTILQEKETIHYRIIIRFTNLFICLKLWKFQQQRQHWTSNGKNWRKFRRGTWQKSEEKKGDRWSKDVGRKSSFCLINGHMSFEKCWIGGKAPKIQRSSCTPMWYCKGDSGSYAVFTEQGPSASQMTAAKVMDIISRLRGCAGQAADAVSAHTQVKMEDAAKLLKIPKSECPDIGIRPPRHQWSKSWSILEDPVVPLERNVYGHPLAGLIGKAIWENPIETRLGEGFQLGMLIRTPSKRIILICVCGWHQIGWKETKH